ncbi:MAG TPA: 50S ribosomal protein L19e [Candidatus Nanoarchaeia archaeon]|nr:50S ribosomal protein L19e [Candidatus Nanoarchaeia archaeon]
MTLPQKRLAASLLKAGIGRVWLDPQRMEDIEKALSRQDIKGLISQGAIRPKQKTGISRGRTRQHLNQKRKGRRKGQGSRRGKTAVREHPKRQWVHKIRLQRRLFTHLKNTNLISLSTYHTLRQKSKGGFFRSQRHVKLYLTEKGLWKQRT